MHAVKKKIMVGAIVIAIAGTISIMNASSGNSELSKENILTGNDADIAVKFTEYIHDYAKQKNEREFNRRFRIPPEESGYTRTELQKIDTLGTVEKVTCPASGKNQRFVYYKKDDNCSYKFKILNSKNKWLFQGLAVMEKK